MSEWIAVCGEEGDNPIEVETEDGQLYFYLLNCFKGGLDHIAPGSDATLDFHKISK